MQGKIMLTKQEYRDAIIQFVRNQHHVSVDLYTHFDILPADIIPTITYSNIPKKEGDTNAD